MFEYSCFISYRNPQYELGSKFVDQFCEALNGELEQLNVPGLFRDQDHNQTGGLIDPMFARALCRSACMIAISNPGYFSPKHPYCAREYRAMEILEEGRLSALSSMGIAPSYGLILPVYYRGSGRLPSKIIDERFSSNFSKFQLGGTRMSHNAQFNTKIENIASYIAQRHNELAQIVDLCSNCNEFTLPTAESLETWLSGMESTSMAFPRGSF